MSDMTHLLLSLLKRYLRSLGPGWLLIIVGSVASVISYFGIKENISFSLAVTIVPVLIGIVSFLSSVRAIKLAGFGLILLSLLYLGINLSFEYLAKIIK